MNIYTDIEDEVDSIRDKIYADMVLFNEEIAYFKVTQG